MPAHLHPPTVGTRFHFPLLSLVLGLFGVLSGVATSFGQEEPPRAKVNIVDETRWLDTIKYVPKPFTAKATVTFQDVSLPEIASWLQEQVGYPVLIDQFSFQEAERPSDDVISDELLDEPIYLLLDRLRYAGVHWLFENDVVQFYAFDKGEERTVGNRQYVVSDLLDQGYTQATLIHAIHDAIDCSWDIDGGSCSVNLLGDVLFARLPAESLRYLESLLEALRDPCRRTLVNEPAQNIRLRATLDKRFSVDWRDKPLVLALEEFSKQMGEPIRIDRAALKQRKFSERTLVSLSATEQKASLILERLLKRHGLNWVLRDGVIRIGNLLLPTDEETPFQLTAVYDVRDLAQNAKESAGLAAAIFEQIQGDWELNGGRDVVEFPIPGILIVRAVERSQDQLLELLGNYRIALKNSKVRVSADTDPNAKITRFYRMPSSVAFELLVLLPQMVATDSWKSESNPDGIGTIRLVRSWDEPIRVDQQVSSVPHSVLIIDQRRSLHEEIETFMNKVRFGDVWTQGGMGSGGMGGVMGSGGMGGGGMGGGGMGGGGMGGGGMGGGGMGGGGMGGGGMGGGGMGGGGMGGGGTGGGGGGGGGGMGGGKFGGGMF